MSKPSPKGKPSKSKRTRRFAKVDVAYLNDDDDGGVTENPDWLIGAN